MKDESRSLTALEKKLLRNLRVRQPDRQNKCCNFTFLSVAFLNLCSGLVATNTGWKVLGNTASVQGMRAVHCCRAYNFNPTTVPSTSCYDCMSYKCDVNMILHILYTNVSLSVVWRNLNGQHLSLATAGSRY